MRLHDTALTCTRWQGLGASLDYSLATGFTDWGNHGAPLQLVRSTGLVFTDLLALMPGSAVNSPVSNVVDAHAWTLGRVWPGRYAPMLCGRTKTASALR